MLNIETLVVGPLGVNCVLAWDPALGQGVVVDPGSEPGRIAARVEALGFQVQALLHTHGHFDHLGATRALQTRWACPAFLHPADFHLVQALDLQTSMFGMPPVEEPDMRPLGLEDSFLGLSVLHTPGHSSGCCCFHGEHTEGPLLLSGDTLFAGGVGRTDIGGSWEQLERSVRRLYELPDACRVLPGHGPETTIGAEALGNPYVRR